MSTSIDFNLVSNIHNFLISAQPEVINAHTVIYQVFKTNCNISLEVLRAAVHQALLFDDIKIKAQEKVVEILTKFDDAFHGIYHLHTIGALKVNLEVPRQNKEIEGNVQKLKRKFSRAKNLPSSTAKNLYTSLLNYVNKMSIADLTWKDPLGSQIISDKLDIIEQLSDNERKRFLEPRRNMVPDYLPQVVEDACDNFVQKFVPTNNSASEFYLHDGMWKETDKKLKYITKGILEVLKNCWDNPVLKNKSVNEGTYMNTVIMPTIQAALKKTPFNNSMYISCSERQSYASAKRKGDGKCAKKPDIMVEFGQNSVTYEVLYGECSRLDSLQQKEEEDEVKLWRQVNDGMYLLRRSCRPQKSQFGILGVQVFRNKLSITALVRDEGDINCYYHLIESEIPVQRSDTHVVTEFVKSLLILRNILIVNMTLIYNASPKTGRSEDSSTVTSPKKRKYDY